MLIIIIVDSSICTCGGDCTVVRLPIVELLVLGSLLVDPALSVGDASLPVPLVYDLVLDLLPNDLVLERALELDVAEAASSFPAFCSGS